jgi:peptide/nickel transport system substrate-binding protein
MKHAGIALGTVGLLTFALAGAGVGGMATAEAAGPQSGGTAVYALQPQTSPNWFYPEVSLTADTVVNAQTDAMMYQPLLYFNKNDALDLGVHSLASSVTWNKSGTVYTVKLNPRWHWSNGRPVTAQDVVFTYDIMEAGSEYNTNYAWTFSGQGFGGFPSLWKSVVAKNADTVVITIKTPRNPQWFIRDGIDQIIPVPKSVWDKYPTNMKKEMAFINSVANSPTNPVYHVVDGPYLLKSYQPDDNWTFVPNPRYDGHKSYLSKVIFEYITSDTSEFTGLKEGTINVGYLTPELIKSKGELPNDQLTVAYPLGFDYFNFNLSPKAPGGIGKAFATLPVRQALQYGINQKAIINGIFDGYGVVDDTTLAPEPKTPYFDPALAKQPYPYNPTLGKQILEKNGWTMKNGVMTKNGIKLEFTLFYASGSNSETDLVTLLKSDWAKEGIDVNLVSQPFDTVVSYSQADANKWAMIDWDQGNFGGWTYGNPFPSGDGLFNTGGAENSGGYSNAEMNALITKTLEPGTTKQVLQNMYAYETYAAKQLPGAIFLPWEPLFNVNADNIHNVSSTYNPIGSEIFPNYWWISK